jgi:hypothetical protein
MSAFDAVTNSDDMLCHILSFLTQKQKLNIIPFICKQWHRATNLSTSWQDLECHVYTKHSVRDIVANLEVRIGKLMHIKYLMIFGNIKYETESKRKRVLDDYEFIVNNYPDIKISRDYICTVLSNRSQYPAKTTNLKIGLDSYYYDKSYGTVPETVTNLSIDIFDVERKHPMVFDFPKLQKFKCPDVKIEKCLAMPLLEELTLCGGLRNVDQQGLANFVSNAPLLRKVVLHIGLEKSYERISTIDQVVSTFAKLPLKTFKITNLKQEDFKTIMKICNHIPELSISFDREYNECGYATLRSLAFYTTLDGIRQTSCDIVLGRNPPSIRSAQCHYKRENYISQDKPEFEKLVRDLSTYNLRHVRLLISEDYALVKSALDHFLTAVQKSATMSLSIALFDYKERRDDIILAVFEKLPNDHRVEVVEAYVHDD